MIAQKKVIFTDEDVVHQASDDLAALQEGKGLPIPEGEYKEIVKEAYKEGMKDAIKEMIKSRTSDSSQAGIEEGKKEQTKETAKVEEVAKQKMDTLAQKMDIVLFQAKTVFPFDLFPDSILIDTSKVSVVQRAFIASAYVTTVLLKDVTDVVVETSPLLANLKITYSHNPMKPLTCNLMKMKKTDALRAKEILEGILVVHREGIDLSKVSPETMVTFVENLGKTKIKEFDSTTHSAKPPQDTPGA